MRIVFRRRRAPRPATSTARHSGARRGVALVIALLAIVAIGALVAGAFFSSTQEYRIGRNSVYEPRALAVAEYGLNSSLETLRSGAQALTANGATVALPGVTALNGVDAATVQLTRLTPRTYLLVAEGTAGSNAEMRTVRSTGLVLSHVVPTMKFLAALTTRGSTKIGGSSIIDGNDQNPAGWTECAATGAAMPGIVNDNPGVNITKSGSNVVVSGDPAMKTDPAAADTSTYFKFGDADWKSLTDMADVRLPSSWSDKPGPVVVSNVCVAGNSNWGDSRRSSPKGKCESRFPIIYAPGNLDVQGGFGQGILLVEGDLKVTGGFEFYGPVIVRGSLTTQGTGGHFNGGVMAANVNLEQNVVLGDAVISYSKCAIEQATNQAGSQRPVAARSWTALY